MTTDPKDTRLDWALSETLGHEAPPDLAAATLARWRAGEAAGLQRELAEATRPPRRLAAIGWLMAALVVLAFALWPRAEQERATPAVPSDDAPQEPVGGRVRMPTVRSRAEVDALPPGALGVIGEGLDDDAVQGLVRLRKLRWLELRYPEAMVLGLGLKTVPPANPPCITAKSFAVFGSLAQLRTLRLVGAWRVTEDFPLATPQDLSVPTSASGLAAERERSLQSTIGQLERLPLLRELALTHFDVPSWALAPLARMPELRELELTANYGVDADAIAILLQCTRLERLDLGACMALPATAIAELGKHPSLADLDVGDLDGMQWRSGERPFLGAGTRSFEQHAHEVHRNTRCGVTDEAIDGLANAKRLRRLRMSQPSCTLAGLQRLADFPALVDLDLFGFGGEPAQPDALARFLPQLESLKVCGAFGDGFCKTLRETQPKLRKLEIPACYAITDAGLAELLAIDSLRELDVRQSRGLTVAAMESLKKAKQIEVLDLRHVDWVTKAHEEELKALPRLRELLTSARE